MAYNPRWSIGMDIDIFNLNFDLEQTQPDSGCGDDVFTEDPYWKVDSVQLRQFLQLASSFTWRVGRDLTSKSVSIGYNEGNLICRATDFDSYLEYKIQNLSDKPILNTLIFPTATLLKVASITSFFILKQSTEGIFILLFGKWIPLESVDLDSSQYINEDPIEEHGCFTIPDNMSQLYQISSSAMIPKDRNIVFTPNLIQSTLLWSVIQLSIDSTLSLSWVLTSREALLLKAFKTSVSVGVTKSDLPRIVLSSPTCKLYFIHRIPESNVIDIILPDNGIRVMKSGINDLVAMSDNLPNSLGKLLFKYDNHLMITYCSKICDTEYTIPSTAITTSPASLKEAAIQCTMLKQVMKVFSSSILSLYWDDSSLYLKDEGVEARILFEA